MVAQLERWVVGCRSTRHPLSIFSGCWAFVSRQAALPELLPRQQQQLARARHAGSVSRRLWGCWICCSRVCSSPRLQQGCQQGCSGSPSAKVRPIQLLLGLLRLLLLCRPHSLLPGLLASPAQFLLDVHAASGSRRLLLLLLQLRRLIPERRLRCRCIRAAGPLQQRQYQATLCGSVIVGPCWRCRRRPDWGGGRCWCVACRRHSRPSLRHGLLWHSQQSSRDSTTSRCRQLPQQAQWTGHLLCRQGRQPVLQQLQQLGCGCWCGRQGSGGQEATERGRHSWIRVCRHTCHSANEGRCLRRSALLTPCRQRVQQLCQGVALQAKACQRAELRRMLAPHLLQHCQQSCCGQLLLGSHVRCCCRNELAAGVRVHRGISVKGGSPRGRGPRQRSQQLLLARRRAD